MPKFPNSELLELFFLEFNSYIPEIRHGLEEISSDRSALPAIQELHRLFHNIKGAASQVQLSDLSNGAKVVESALDELLEAEPVISDRFLEALKKTADLLVKHSEHKNHDVDQGRSFHEQIVSLFSQIHEDQDEGDRSDDNGARQLQEYLQDVRSIFPLLRDLVGCLKEDGSDNSHNLLIYGKLSHAISLLATTLLTAGMKQQSHLMRDCHVFIEKLHSSAIPHQPEIAGLVQDFLQFLEVSFSHEDPESSITIKRVNDQLGKFKTLLAGVDLRENDSLLRFAEELPFKDNNPDDDSLDIFDEPVNDDESIDFLDELAESSFLGAEIGGAEAGEEFTFLSEEAEAGDEPIDEDQQLLLDIFREECDEHLIVINQSLNILESKIKEPTDLTPELLESVSDMRRAVHTLKGAASMTGVNLLAKGAHSLEDLLDWLHDEAGRVGPDEVRIIASGIDIIEVLSQSPQATASAGLDRLVKTITDYLAIKSGAEPTGDASPEIPSPESVKVESADLADLSPPAGVDTSLKEVVQDNAMAALPGDVGTVRVRLEDLDELVSIEGELVVARGAVEKIVDEFSQTLLELETVKENLRRKSQELESGFEVQSLYGFNPFTAQESDGDQINSELADFDPIELDRYSQLNLIIRSLNEISVDVNSIHTTLSSLAGNISGQVGKQQLTMRLMQEKLMRIRMTPLSSISRVLFRTVRDTAVKLGKKVVLTVAGEDVFMDRFVWAKITDPLMHILRNCVDHGIESAEVRAAGGKPETGTIHLQAEQRSRYVVLRINDDGGGIDYSLIKDKIRREGLAEDPEAISEKGLLEYLFHSSFTTRQNVTTISGRGVGLDVVRRNIQELRGSIEIHNNPGQGVEFEIHIPFSLSVNRAAMVLVTGKEYAIPLQDIMQVKHFSTREILDTGGTEGLLLKYGDRVVPVNNLGYHLQLEKRMDTLPKEAEGLMAVMFKNGEELHAVAIDSVVEQREIIVKNLGSHLTNVRGISGVTLTGAGGLIPILNLRELVETKGTEEVVETEPLLQMELNEPLKVLIVDDSISVRHSVARLVESKSWKQQQAVDGLDALAKLESYFPDVIILDIEMPRMNGYEFKSSLNNQPMYKDIPIVMLTSRASEKHQQKAKELGIEYYLTKPYQDETFVRMLETIHNRS